MGGDFPDGTFPGENFPRTMPQNMRAKLNIQNISIFNNQEPLIYLKNIRSTDELK